MTAIETDSKGIPLKSSYPETPSVPVIYTIFNTIIFVIGSAAAYFAIIRNNKEGDAKVALLAEYDLGYLYLTAVVLKLGQLLMGTNLGVHRKEAKVNVPDQQVYQVKGAEGSKLGYVLLENEGVLGRFNRAQRSVQNFNENFPQTMLYILLAGFVYPKEVLVLSSVFAVSRYISAIGYTAGADGRTKGFMLANLAIAVVEALVVISGVRAIQM